MGQRIIDWNGGKQPSYLLMGENPPRRGRPPFKEKLDDVPAYRREPYYGRVGEYYHGNRWLVDAPAFSKPRAMLTWLRGNRQEKEPLWFLTQALLHGKAHIPPGKRNEFLLCARGADCWWHNKWLHRAPDFRDDPSPLQAIGWIMNNTPMGMEKTDVLASLWYGRRIPDGSLMTYAYYLSGARHFEDNGWLHSAPRFPSAAIARTWLKENRPNGSPGIPFLSIALWYGGKIEDGMVLRKRNKRTPDYYALQKHGLFVRESLEAVERLGCHFDGTGYSKYMLWKKLRKSRFPKIGKPAGTDKQVETSFLNKAFNIAWEKYLVDDLRRRTA